MDLEKYKEEVYDNESLIDYNEEIDVNFDTVVIDKKYLEEADMAQGIARFYIQTEDTTTPILMVVLEGSMDEKVLDRAGYKKLDTYKVITKDRNLCLEKEIIEQADMKDGYNVGLEVYKHQIAIYNNMGEEYKKKIDEKNEKKTEKKEEKTKQSLDEIKAIHYIMNKIYKKICTNDCTECFCHHDSCGGCPGTVAHQAELDLEARRAQRKYAIVNNMTEDEEEKFWETHNRKTWWSEEDEADKDESWKKLVKKFIED